MFLKNYWTRRRQVKGHFIVCITLFTLTVLSRFIRFNPIGLGSFNFLSFSIVSTILFFATMVAGFSYAIRCTVLGLEAIKAREKQAQDKKLAGLVEEAVARALDKPAPPEE